MERSILLHPFYLGSGIGQMTSRIKVCLLQHFLKQLWQRRSYQRFHQGFERETNNYQLVDETVDFEPSGYLGSDPSPLAAQLYNLG